ncbi:acetyltransferase [Sphingomonas sp. Leaf17]|uniref:GNAT family N-acetyltransferase n=1 Tax=Sphingomonas sp. Leaf17 TaxID=1735683 RepID=UPI0006FCCC50|nr:GNAT family N-acetyltransferase [Sphingomonas sp. Leaf17]KQM65863.1 acetyltransferase [Sphingomonas sp. Leaf17]
MPWRLRQCEPGDSPALAMVAAATFLETFAGILPGPDIVAHCGLNSSADRFADWIQRSDSIVMIAEHSEGAAPVGYTMLVPPDLPVDVDPDTIELRRIYTLSLTRGTGLGSMLMAQAIADARAMGKTRMLLGVLGTNRRARDFYERHGFAAIGERRFRVGDSWADDLIYGRLIEG